MNPPRSSAARATNLRQANDLRGEQECRELHRGLVESRPWSCTSFNVVVVCFAVAAVDALAARIHIHDVSAAIMGTWRSAICFRPLSQCRSPGHRTSGLAANTQIYPGLISIYTADTIPLSNWHIHNSSASAADDSRPDVIPLTLAATYINAREHAKWGNVRLLVRG